MNVTFIARSISYRTDLAKIKAKNPKGIIFTGGPNSAYLPDSPTIDPEIYTWGVPILGICYGSQLMMHMLGGKVCKAPEREYGKTVVDLDTTSPLFAGLPDKNVCWMSHNDYIETAAPGFEIVAHTPNCPVAAAQDKPRGLYCVQFHPEVLHTENGTQILHNFVYNVCGCAGDLEDGLLRGEQRQGPAREDRRRQGALRPVRRCRFQRLCGACWPRPSASS